MPSEVQRGVNLRLLGRGWQWGWPYPLLKSGIYILNTVVLPGTSTLQLRKTQRLEHVFLSY